MIILWTLGSLEEVKNLSEAAGPLDLGKQEMSKVEKNATVEVKVVKVDDEGGEFHTQVDAEACTENKTSYTFYLIIPNDSYFHKQKLRR